MNGNALKIYEALEKESSWKTRKLRRKELDEEDISQEAFMKCLSRFEDLEKADVVKVIKYGKGEISNIIERELKHLRRYKNVGFKICYSDEIALQNYNLKRGRIDLLANRLTSYSTVDIYILAVLEVVSTVSKAIEAGYFSRRRFENWRKNFSNRLTINIPSNIQQNKNSNLRGKTSNLRADESLHPEGIQASIISSNQSHFLSNKQLTLTQVNGERKGEVGNKNNEKAKKNPIYGICKVLPDLEAVQGLLLNQQIDVELSGSGLYVTDTHEGCCDSTWKQKIYLYNGMYRWKCYKCQETAHERWPNTLEGFLMSIFGTFEEVKKVIRDFSRD
ncbi:MAG: hypothetical protein HOJ62_07525 [Planctomycetaceae bacterium]|nr:hypothetical protein [Planctomycetaceae bacterium]